MSYKIKTLNNGMRIVTVQLPQSETVTVLTLVNTGSDYEHENEAGISHFLEHMCFKGTTKRPTAHSISLELDSLGAEVNAFTGNEITGYYAKGDSRHWKKFIDVIADVYLNSTFPEEEIRKEKGVICEEINMYEDMPNYVVQERMESFMYGDNPVGKSVIGTKKSVNSFTRKDFLNYHKRRYSPYNTVIVVAGPVKDIEVAKEVEKHFKNFKGKKVSKLKPVKIIKNKKSILTIEKNTDQVHTIIGFNSYNRSNKKVKDTQLITGLLGSGMSSRLFQLLREELGVCYYVSASQSLRTHSGRVLISSGVTKEKVDMVIKEILKECKKIITDTITEEEVRKVKNYLIGMSKMNLESSDQWASFYGKQVLFDKEIKTIDQKIKDIESVTIKQIKDTAKDLFSYDNLYIGSIGPKGHTILSNKDIKDLL